jgi:hypothetical protein
MNWLGLFQWFWTLVRALQEQVRQLQSQLGRLQSRVKELEGRLALNSRNSGKPPSSDGLAKAPAPKSLRRKTGRRIGGQPGHPGATLQRVENPDRICVHALEQCPCGRCQGGSSLPLK